MRTFFVLLSTLILGTSQAAAMDACKALPSTIQVMKRSKQCGKVPTVLLKDKWKGSFSAAFRWDDGSASGQDRNPFALDDSSASSSPYKTQRRIRTNRGDYLCYGKFLNRQGYPVPEQLTIKRTAAPRVNRFCVSFE